MSNSAFPPAAFPIDDISGVSKSPGLAKGEIVKGGALASELLSGIELGSQVRVVELALDEDLAAWLRAVGIGEGDTLTVLRHAAFGGPIHVRTSSGGEFALNRSLAICIQIRRLAKGGETAA